MIKSFRRDERRAVPTGPFPQNLREWNGDAGEQYTGLDRFGRVTRMMGKERRNP